jgi:hypothetical protein
VFFLKFLKFLWFLLTLGADLGIDEWVCYNGMILLTCFSMRILGPEVGLMSHTLCIGNATERYTADT